MAAAVSPAYDVWTVAEGRLDLTFFELLLRSPQARARYRLKMRGTAGRRRVLDRDDFLRIEFPLPSREVQEAIAAEVAEYQRAVDGAEAILRSYRPRVSARPDWPAVRLGEVCTMGGTITADIDPALPYLGADSIEANTGRLLKVDTAGSQRVSGPVYEFSGERLLYSKIRPYLNKLTIVDMHGYCSSDMYPLVADRAKADLTYLAAYMLSDAFAQSIHGYYERASIPKLNRSQLFGTTVALPPLRVQRQIAAEVQAEGALVAATRELGERFERRIQDALARVWGEEEAP